jgi:putative lipoic acid-binding regulatory protein
MSEDSLIEYPSDFPIKVMGKYSDDFARNIIDIVLRHAPDYAPETVELRASSGGSYQSVTCTIRAVSREQLDNLYRELSGHPAVKVVL